MHSHTCSVELLGFAMPISINGINEKYGFPNRLEGSWSSPLYLGKSAEIHRNTLSNTPSNTQKYPSKNPKQKHLQDPRIFIIELTLNN